MANASSVYRCERRYLTPCKRLKLSPPPWRKGTDPTRGSHGGPGGKFLGFRVRFSRN